jgi:hypothetical protein
MNSKISNNVAAAKLPPGKARDAALQLRDQLADKMTPAQITDAQKLTREWKPKAAATPPAKPWMACSLQGAVRGRVETEIAASAGAPSSRPMWHCWAHKHEG